MTQVKISYTDPNLQSLLSKQFMVTLLFKSANVAEATMTLLKFERKA